MEEIEEKLCKYNQSQIIKYFGLCNDEQKKKLISDLEQIDFEQIDELYKVSKNINKSKIDIKNIKHIEYYDKKTLTSELKEKVDEIGENVIRKNEYAIVTMAGGQGTRLEHNGPKGTFLLKVSPKQKYLFEILAESLIENNKKYGITLNWYIMTSQENNDETVEFFEKHNYFEYPKNSIKFFKQGEMPMLDENGKLIINDKLEVKLAADGNGCTYKSLKDSGMIDDMKAKNIKWVFIGSVDNAILNMVDQTLLGLTIYQNNQIASKSIVKSNPNEKVGVFCKINNKLSVIEYSEMPEGLAEMRDEKGELLFGESHIMCNLFSIDAIEKISNEKLPYHSAHKKSNYLDENGNLIIAQEPNAYKYEAFIFDAFKFFDEMTILRGEREEDFAPIKNKLGVDSPETAIKLYNNKMNKKI